MARNARSGTRSRHTVLVRMIVRLVLLAFALVVAASLTVVTVLPRATQGSALTVLTGSMTPTIPVGSVVLVRPVDPGTLRVGDVATYQARPGEDDYITHRIVRIDTSTTPTTFTFKGDANRGADVDPVLAGAIRGEVWFHVPWLGAVRDGLHGRGGVTLLAMLLLGGYAVSQLSGAFRDRDRPGAHRARGRSTGPRIDRTLVLATFDRTEPTVADLDPADLARRWGAILLDHDASHFRLLIAPPPDGVVAAVEVLHTFRPRGIEVCQAPLTLRSEPTVADTGESRTGLAATRRSSTERDRATG